MIQYCCSETCTNDTSSSSSSSRFGLVSSDALSSTIRTSRSSPSSSASPFVQNGSVSSKLVRRSSAVYGGASLVLADGASNDDSNTSASSPGTTADLSSAGCCYKFDCPQETTLACDSPECKVSSDLVCEDGECALASPGGCCSSVTPCGGCPSSSSSSGSPRQTQQPDTRSRMTGSTTTPADHIHVVHSDATDTATACDFGHGETWECAMGRIGLGEFNNYLDACHPHYTPFPSDGPEGFIPAFSPLYNQAQQAQQPTPPSEATSHEILSSVASNQPSPTASSLHHLARSPTSSASTASSTAFDILLNAALSSAENAAVAAAAAVANANASGLSSTHASPIFPSLTTSGSVGSPSQGLSSSYHSPALSSKEFQQQQQSSPYPQSSHRQSPAASASTLHHHSNSPTPKLQLSAEQQRQLDSLQSQIDEIKRQATVSSPSSSSSVKPQTNEAVSLRASSHDSHSHSPAPQILQPVQAVSAPSTAAAPFHGLVPSGLDCQWSNCGETFPTLDQLLEHFRSTSSHMAGVAASDSSTVGGAAISGLGSGESYEDFTSAAFRQQQQQQHEHEQQQQQQQEAARLALTCQWGSDPHMLSVAAAMHSSANGGGSSDMDGIVEDSSGGVSNSLDALVKHLLEDHLANSWQDVFAQTQTTDGCPTGFAHYFNHHSDMTPDQFVSTHSAVGGQLHSSHLPDPYGHPLTCDPAHTCPPNGGCESLHHHQHQQLATVEVSQHQQHQVTTTACPLASNTASSVPKRFVLKPLPPRMTTEDAPTIHSCGYTGCTETFPDTSTLTEHLNTVHVGAGKDSYVCGWEGCARGLHGPIFKSKQKIMRHLQSHTGHKPFVCGTCKQTFSEAATLQQHMRRHTNEKPYICDYPGCNKSFALTASLTIHRRTHDGVKPFICPHCDRAFVEASNLTKHIRTHTGDKPFPCLHPGCGKRFARPDQLNRHAGVHDRKAAAAAAATALGAAGDGDVGASSLMKQGEKEKESGKVRNGRVAKKNGISARVKRERIVDDEEGEDEENEM